VLAVREALTRLFLAVAPRLTPAEIVTLRNTFHPSVEGYAYVELLPSSRFQWTPELPRLPEALVPLVARVRTDLDRFSDIEISALMFHGYTLIDHCLRAYHPGWLPVNTPPPQFEAAEPHVRIQWTTLGPNDIERYRRHLEVSHSRALAWRWLRRRWLSLEAWFRGA